MHLYVFEDSRTTSLEPLALTRPVFDLRCGAGTLLEYHLRYFTPIQTTVLVRDSIAGLCRLLHPEIAVNPVHSPGRVAQLLVNARWLPPATPAPDLSVPQAARVGEELAYMVLPPDAVVSLDPAE